MGQDFNRKQICVWLSPERKSYIKELAVINNRSMSNMCVALIEEGINISKQKESDDTIS